MGLSQSALHGMQAMFYHDGTNFCDDKLTEAEMDLICGVYKVYTGLGTQCADCSWWPKQSVWELSGLNVGYWSPDCEIWFQAHLATIHQGTAGLKGS